MPELVVIVPSRGRPHTVTELAAAFRETCTADTSLMFAIDEGDPLRGEYVAAVRGEPRLNEFDGRRRRIRVRRADTTSMVDALNEAARAALERNPSAIGFMGDDHRPRTKGWDRAYLDALQSLPGITYGNDLLQGPNLPTQCAMSASVVRALGHMAPSVLTHLYVDNYWLRLGQAAGCISYLPTVVVEHVHPIAGKVAWDEGHRRVNAPELYQRDKAAGETYWAEHGEHDVLTVLGAAGAMARG